MELIKNGLPCVTGLIGVVVSGGNPIGGVVGATLGRLVSGTMDGTPTPSDFHGNTAQRAAAHVGDGLEQAGQSFQDSSVGHGLEHAVNYVQSIFGQ
jgi:hypothetical protein